MGYSNINSDLIVIGNIYSSNGLSTTNVLVTRFSAGGFVVTAEGPTVGVTGNVYVSNTLVSTNVIVTGNASGLFLGTFSGSSFTGGNFQGGTFTASTGFVASGGYVTAANFTGGSFSGTTITAGTGFSTTGYVTAANFTGGSFSGGTHSGTTITAGTGFSTTGYVTAGSFTGASYNATTGFSGAAFTGGSFYTNSNIYAANALSTTNIFASNILSVGTGTIGSNIALFSNIGGGQNVVVINSNAWVGIGTTNPTSSLTVNGNASFTTDTFTVPFATVGTLGVLGGATIGPSSTVLGSNLLVLSNSSGGSNVTVFRGNTVGISNLAPATTLSVGGTISALGNATTFGTLAPVTWRQGSSSSDWSGTVGARGDYSLGTSRVQIQCGANAMTSSTTITFPSPYINIPIVMVTPYSTIATPLYITSPSSTVFTVNGPAGVSVQFEWISIGI